MENSRKVPVVIVDAIYANRKDSESPNKTLQLRCEQEREGSGVLSQFLVGGQGFVEKRVCFQTMHQDKIDELDLQQGDDINDIFTSAGQQPVKLVVTEISQSELVELSKQGDNSHLGFTPKINPETKEYLVSTDGEYIYRKVSVGTIEASDRTVSHSGSTKEAPEEVTVTSNIGSDLPA